jgi:hypothetical protein
MKMTSDYNETYKKEFSAAAKKYGSPYSIPNDVLHAIGERLRAQSVVEKYDGNVTPNLLRSYSVPVSIIEEICGAKPVIEKKVKRADRRRAIEEWADENPGTTVTPQTLSEVGEVSYTTVMSIITERPDLFTKVKRGYYLVRDPKADRSTT